MLSEGWKLSGKHGAQVVGTTSAGPLYNGREALAVRVQPENFYTMWSMEWQLSTAVREGVGASTRLGDGTGVGNLRFGRRYGRTTIGAQVGHFDTNGYPVVRGDQAGSIDENADSRSTTARVRIQRQLDNGEVSLQAGGFTESRGNGTPLTDNSTDAGFVSARASRKTSSGSAAASGFVQIQRFDSRFSSQAADRSTESPALDQHRVPSWARRTYRVMSEPFFVDFGEHSIDPIKPSTGCWRGCCYTPELALVQPFSS